MFACWLGALYDHVYGPAVGRSPTCWTPIASRVSGSFDEAAWKNGIARTVSRLGSARTSLAPVAASNIHEVVSLAIAGSTESRFPVSPTSKIPPELTRAPEPRAAAARSPAPAARVISASASRRDIAHK